MKQYIDKDALIAKIEELKEKDEAEILPSYFSCGRLSICEELMDFLDIIEVKEVDIEKEFDKCCENYTFDDECEVYTARRFFELGLKAKRE